jgi:hypothetical protein
MKMVNSWRGNNIGRDVEVKLEFVGGPEKIFPDLYTSIITGSQGTLRMLSGN